MNYNRLHLNSNIILRNKVYTGALLALLLILLQKKTNEKRSSNAKIKIRQRRKLWARKWLLRRDNSRGMSNLVFNELAVEDQKSFKNFTRMSVNTFEHLLLKVKPFIERKDTVLRESISARTRSESETLPRISSKNFDRDELGAPFKEVTLEAGDFLYFPRGMVHEGRTDPESHSLHITVSTYQKTAYVDLLEKALAGALKNAAKDNIEYREGLPIGYLKHLGCVNSSNNDSVRAEILAKLHRLFVNLVNHAPFDAAADVLGKQFMWDAMPPVLSRDERSRSVLEDGERLEKGEVVNRGEIGLDTKIRLTRYYSIRLAVEEDQIKLYYNTENARVYHGEEQQFVELTANMIPAINCLLNAYPSYVPVERIPLEDGLAKMQLAADLWERGILITKRPLEQPDY